MYVGNNPKAVASQDKITKALLSLMEGDDFSAITIKEICANAGVSRQTFYSLFETKDEVIGRHFDIMFDFFAKDFCITKNTDVLALCDLYVAYISYDIKFITLLVKNNLSHLITKKLEDDTYKIYDIYDRPDLPLREYAIAFFAGAMGEVVDRYVKKGCDIDIKEISALFASIISGEYIRAIKDS